MEDLAKALPVMCQAVQDALGSTNLEATYQRALKLDLEAAGLVVISEVEVPLTWRGTRISTRRADLIVRTPDGSTAVLELKAVCSGLGRENLRQLEYYMAHFHVPHGFLVNFPHDAGFPDVEADLRVGVFEAKALSGEPVGLSASHNTRSRGRRNDQAVVQVTQVVLKPQAPEAGRAGGKDGATKALVPKGGQGDGCVDEAGLCVDDEDDAAGAHLHRSGQGKAKGAQRRCGNCGETGHDKRKCKQPAKDGTSDGPAARGRAAHGA